MEPGSSTVDDVLVVIPCLNEESHIERVIAAVLCDPAAGRALLVVADGGSTDRTCAIVGALAERHPQLRLLHNPKRIQSAAVNRAACLFGTGRRWLVRMDAHADYPRGFVSRLIAEAERTAAASVVVAMKARGLTCFQRAVAAAQNSLLGAGGSPHRRAGNACYVDHGHHALFDLARFLGAGGYDETQSHNEDAEFDVRLARAGGRIWLTRQTEVVYFPRGRPEDLYLQYQDHGRGRAQTIMRHRLRPKVRQLAPACVLPALFAACLAPLASLAAAPALLWLAACMISGVALGIRQRSRCALAAGFAAPIMHLGWSVGFWSVFVEVAGEAVPRPVGGLLPRPR
ncbi:MAG TPA: glycosyltransferase family 2 protein [Rhizomicrobium sp.]|jgi:succinoglycan biosynthesis protein ExoA